MSDGPRMLVSLGAQKAATTWLAEYLAQHPQCDRTPMKETHYFDYYDHEITGLGRARIRQRYKQLLKRGKSNPKLRKSAGFKRAKQYYKLRLAVIDLGEPTYSAYEALILSAARKKTKIVGDITPANGLLSVERLKGIAALPNKPLFVLTMRDPVDRTWSALRMMSERRVDEAAFEADVRQRLADFLAADTGVVHMRSDYATMLNKIDAAIPADRVSIDFFEEFLNQPKIDALCDFLGIDHHPADLATKKLSGKSLKMTDDEKRALSAKLRPVYDAVETRMGRLPDRWIANRDLAA